MDEPGSTIRHTLFLRRVDAEATVARFYALMIEHDLFGRVVLVRRWGRIGRRGRERPGGSVSEAARRIPTTGVSCPPRNEPRAQLQRREQDRRRCLRPRPEAPRA
jgi:hypothetical protein